MSYAIIYIFVSHLEHNVLFIINHAA